MTSRTGVQTLTKFVICYTIAYEKYCDVRCAPFSFLSSCLRPAPRASVYDSDAQQVRAFPSHGGRGSDEKTRQDDHETTTMDKV